jgi:hypothetical protein
MEESLLVMHGVYLCFIAYCIRKNIVLSNMSSKGVSIKSPSIRG